MNLYPKGRKFENLNAKALRKEFEIISSDKDFDRIDIERIFY